MNPLIFRPAFLALAVLASSCTKSVPTSSSPGSSLTVSGKVSAVGRAQSYVREEARADQFFSPMEDGFIPAGSTLTCTTLTNPPVSASSVADSSGSVSLSLAAINVPFVCIVTAPGSTNSVPLVLTSGATTGSMALSSSDLDFGAISVVTNGNGTLVANAALPASASLQLTTPPGLSCLAGTWTRLSAVLTCNGSATAFSTVFTPLPDGTYANAYTETNSIVNTLHLTGNTTTGSNCVTVNSTASLAVGQTFSDIGSWTANPGGLGIIPTGSTITSLTACGAGQVQLSQNAAGAGGTSADHYLVNVCGTTARNTKNVTYNATDSTVSMTYPKACYDVTLTKLSGGGWNNFGAGFIADLTPGSKCLKNLTFPTGGGSNQVVSLNYQIADNNFSNTYFTAAVGTKISALPGTCGAGNFQVSVNANATGIGYLETYNLSTGSYGAFSFYGQTTAGSPCVSPALPLASLAGYYVSDSLGAITASAGAGVTLQLATGACTGAGFLSYMLSEPAGAAATTGQSIVALPVAKAGLCSLGACFDLRGNAYGGAATCPSGTAALVASTQTDIIPINPDCTRMWTSQSPQCRSAFDIDASLTAHCGTGQTTANTPVSAVRSRYAQITTNCAACFANPTGAPSDFPVNGCVGFGNVTCTGVSNGLDDLSNVVVVKQ